LLGGSFTHSLRKAHSGRQRNPPDVPSCLPASNRREDYVCTIVRPDMYCYVQPIRKRLEVTLSNQPISIETSLPEGKLVHAAVPVRWSLVAASGRGPVELACTYDIHPRGARLIGVRPVSVGDMIQVERGRNRALCQVVWTADPDSPLRGQFTVQCVQGKTPWEDELAQADEEYAPVILNGWKRKDLLRNSENRRRRPRYSVEGKADLIEGSQHAEGRVQQLSEFGAQIAANELLRPGTDFRLMLNVLDVSIGLKAQVRYLVDDLGMGVEFQQIRRGDRPMLEYILRKLGARRVEDFVTVEVVREPLAAVAAG